MEKEQELNIDYDRDMYIDETALDVESCDQASLAMKYIRHYARCRKALTLADEKVKIVRSELIMEANADPEGCCGKKSPNAADIEAYYRNHVRHKAAKTEWVEAQYECDMAEGAKNEICFTRKAMLENMTVLFGQKYFAGPSVPRNLTEERDARRAKDKKVNSGVHRAMQRTS